MVRRQLLNSLTQKFGHFLLQQAIKCLSIDHNCGRLGHDASSSPDWLRCDQPNTLRGYLDFPVKYPCVSQRGCSFVKYSLRRNFGQSISSGNQRHTFASIERRLAVGVKVITTATLTDFALYPRL